MYLLFSFVALILVILWFCSRLLGWLICWVMENQGLGVLTIGRTDFFVFENMSLMLKGGVVLDVEKLWFSSSFISNEVRKPFVLCVSNVRVYLDEQSSSTMQESDEVLEEGEGEGELAGEGQEQFDPPEMNHEILTAHDTRGIMYFASSYLQYVGVSIKTIQVISVQNLSTEQCLIHMSVRQTNLDFNTQNTSQQISITNDNFTAKVLSKTSKEDVDRYVKDAGLSQEHPCLCEASLAFHITYCINATTFTPQVASLLIKKPQVNMKKNLLQLLYAVKKKKRKRVVNRKQSLLHRIQNVVPKIAKLHIDECNVSVQRDPANRNLSVLIGSIDSNIQQAWEEEGFSQTVIMLDMNGLIARSSQVNLVEIREYSLHFMIGDQNVGISSNLRTCFLGYHHEELQYWLAGLIGDSRHQAPVKQPQHKTSSTLPLHLLQDKTLTFSLDLSDCQTIVATAATQGVKFGVTSTKLTVTYKPEVLAGPPKSVLGSCESLRVKIETIGLFCKLTQGGPSTSDLSMKVHHHGTLVYVYFTLITAVKMLSSDPTLDVVLDGVQLETSPTVTATLTQLIRVVFTTAAAATQHRSSVAQRSSTSKDKPDLVADMYVNDADECIDNNAEDIDRHDAAAQHPTIIDLLQTAVMTININCVTAYLCNQLNVCTLLRVDAVNLAQRLKEMTFNVVGCKGVYMINEEKSIAIMRAAEIKQPTVVSIDWFDVTVSMVSKRCVIKLAEQIDIQWTPALHLSVFHAAKDLLDVMHAIQEPKSRDDEGDTQCAATTAQQPSLLMSLMVVVCLNGENRVKFQFSEQHSMTVVTTSLKLLHASDSITLTCANVLVMCDQHDVFTFKDISFVTDPQGLHIQSVRQAKSFKSILTQRTNRLWSFSCELVSIRFPYGYNFAACLEQALNMNKWRKVVHGVVKKKFTAYSPISADLAINIQAFTVQLCDDPFEVKLRDNYELLVDENTESTKRTSAMDKKMKELKKKHGLLNESKVSKLYSSLRERNAHIYIQRSRQLYDNAPMRDKLMTITFHNMSVTCMADPALHGDDNVITHMKDIDSVAPFPESGSISFVTLWCRLVKVSLTSWVVQLRDFQQPIWEVVDLHLWGRLIGAEQRGSFRARRSSTISAGKPWSDVIVERNMPTLKFYHDFSCEMDSWTMAYGTCLEPTVAQCNLSMNLVNRPSVDPSKPLPFWDKQRLLLHGHLTAYSKQVHWLYHASLLNPYNTTEMLDWAWSELMLDWTSGKWVLKGDLDICVRTASKYDDCRLLSLPNLELRIGFNWVCNGNQHAHHSVMPCAPDKVPEYSHQEHPHDSYQAFRSQKLDLEMSFKTTTSTVNPDSQPACHFYNSTLRWLDKVKACMTRVTRPIRRGKLYNTKTSRKPQLTRHLRNAHLSLDIGSFAVHYWASFAKQHGSILYGKVFHVSTSALLSLVEPEGDPTLIRRKQTSWSVQRLLCELDRGSAYLCSANTTGHEEISLREPVKKSFFLSVEKLTYRRGGPPGSDQVTMDPFAEELPNHRVHIYGLKGVWSFVNRNVAFSLYDGYAHAQTLRRNLSADALKGYKVEDASAHTPAQGQRSKSMTSPTLLTPPSLVSTPSPLTKLQSGQAHNMLQKLIAEADSKYVAVSEEVCGGNVQLDQLHGVMACQKEDVAQRNLLVELEGSQVLLQGTETHGSVIASAGKASIISSEHQPIWQARHLKSKTSWTGVVDAMQYYATVDQDISDSTTSNTANSTANDTQSLCWLSRQHIEQSVGTPEGDLPTGISEMLASGKSVGSVVTDLVDTEDNPLDPTCSTVQLQRVSSRCKCQFFYVYYGEVDPDIFPHVPPPPKDESESLNEEESADAFTLLHHDLNVCTNSLQYAMILDIINNVLLFVEPKRKEVHARLQDMRFRLQLVSIDDQRTPIAQRQDTIRCLLDMQRQHQRQLYTVHKALEDTPNDSGLLSESIELEAQLYDYKQQINTQREELEIMVSCFKENQVQNKALKKATKSSVHSVVQRYNEVCFKHAEWRMTEADGQIGIADLVLRNFLYSKTNMEDDSGSHVLEVGWVKVTNLLPNTFYTHTLTLQGSDTQQPDQQMALRILCKFKAPVGGISIKEHFEVNVVPLNIQLTYRLYKAVMAYFFPGKDTSDDGHPGSKAATATNTATQPHLGDDTDSESLSSQSISASSSYNTLHHLATTATTTAANTAQQQQCAGVGNAGGGTRPVVGAVAPPKVAVGPDRSPVMHHRTTVGQQQAPGGDGGGVGQQQLAAPLAAVAPPPAAAVSAAPSDTSNALAVPQQPAGKSRRKQSTKQKVLSHTDADDIYTMKERAAQNNMFIYIKIPEVAVKLSYKGGKTKNVEDIHDLSLLLPTLEYHNQTWTWLDFLMAVKKDSKRVLIGQAIKHRLHMTSRATTALKEARKAESQEEDDKRRMLLGEKLTVGEKPVKKKRSMFGKSSKNTL